MPTITPKGPYDNFPLIATGRGNAKREGREGKGLEKFYHADLACLPSLPSSSNPELNEPIQILISCSIFEKKTNKFSASQLSERTHERMG